MSEETYCELARRLDALPHRYPATESGVEIRFLQKLFTPEQALLGSVMTGEAKPADEIAELAGVDVREVRRTLKDMVRLGLVFLRRKEGLGRQGMQFALMPFVVGFYEAQLHRLDAEMATLFEEYFHASGGLDIPGPSVHRVIPVGESVKGDLDVQPYDQAVALIEGAKSWAVRDCICRKQQKLVDKGCDAPLEVCLTFAPVEGYLRDSRVDRAITKEEALAKLREAADAGLVHTVGNYKENHHYICNCCSCCCGILRRIGEFALPSAVARSAYLAEADADLCIACGACEERCPVGAISIEDVAVVDAGRCIGCGQCTLVCPTEAIALVSRPDAEVLEIPLDEHSWEERRQLARED